MPRKRHTEEQIGFTLRQAEAGTPPAEICRKLGVTEQTFYRWKKRFGELGVAEIRRLRQLEDENRRLKAGRGGPHARQGDAAGRRPPNMVTPSRRRGRRSQLRRSLRA